MYIYKKEEVEIKKKNKMEKNTNKLKQAIDLMEDLEKFKCHVSDELKQRIELMNEHKQMWIESDIECILKDLVELFDQVVIDQNEKIVELECEQEEINMELDRLDLKLKDELMKREISKTEKTKQQNTHPKKSAILKI